MSFSKLTLITLVLLVSHSAAVTDFEASGEAAGCSLYVYYNTAAQTVDISITGPSDVWFGVGFDTRYMMDEPWAIIVDGNGDFTERVLGQHAAGMSVASSCTQTSNTVTNSIREVNLTRLYSVSPVSSYYTFNTDWSNGFYAIFAYGDQTVLAKHVETGDDWLQYAEVSTEEEEEEEEEAEEEAEEEEETEEEEEEEAEEETEEEGGNEEEGGEEEEEQEEEEEEEESNILEGTTKISDVTIDLKLDSSESDGQATITLTGPAGNWYGVGFNAQFMSDKPWTIIVNGDGTIEERKLGYHAEGDVLDATCTVVTSTVESDERTVVITRALPGKSDEYYTFSDAKSINLIAAYGDTATISMHTAKAAGSISLGSGGDDGGDSIKLQMNLAALFVLLAMILRN